MKQIPTSPRAAYERLRVRVFEGDPPGDELADFDALTAVDEAFSEPATGREELDVWVEACGALGLPLPDWTDDQRRDWTGQGWLVVRSDELLRTADEYPNMGRFVQEQYGASFFAVFEQAPQPMRV